MKLSEYEILNKDVFYRCEHILNYIKTHPDIDELEKQSIKATIMDALVYKNLIDKDKEFLDLENGEINNNCKGYHYEKNPDITGIPLWMKEEFRKHCLRITGGISISFVLSKPPSKISRYCVYDPNTAVSSIFDDAVFYETLYISPTRHVKLEKTRPFVEVNINGENYLVDILTKRIIKTSFFKDNFDLEIVSEKRVSELKGDAKKHYDKMTSSYIDIASYLALCYPLIFSLAEQPSFSETIYEVEKSKEIYPNEWAKIENYMKIMTME